MELSNAEITDRLEKYLSDRLQSPVSVANIKSLSGGACQDNYAVDVSVAGGQDKGEYKLVLRTDKGGSLLSSLNRVDEYKVGAMAFKAGVKTPRPYWLEPDPDALGHPFYFMERIQGKATGRYLVKDRSLNDYRKRLPDDLATNLARIHAVTPETCENPALRDKLGDPAVRGQAYGRSAIQDVRNMLPGLPAPRPAVELALNWLDERVPDTRDLVLVHGDFRTGNFMVSPEGLHGIVDWEFAHWGDRHEDIAWLCMRDWRFGKLNKQVGGFADRAAFYAAYEAAAGVEVDPARVLFWEIMGNLRWGVGASQQAERHLSGADKGIELAAIGRRVSEMEFEALRLIEAGA